MNRDADLDRIADAYERNPPRGSALWWEQAYAELWQRRKRAEERARIEEDLRSARNEHRGTDRLGRAAKYLAGIPGGQSGEARNPQAWGAVVRTVRGFALSEGEAMALFESEYAPRCQPRLPHAELRGMVRRALAAHRPPWGYLLEQRRDGR